MKFTNNNGPLSDIILNPEHGGPILCLDANSEITITGSTDHGLRVYNTQTGKQIKELFSKNFGHTEWVTCVKILKNRKVISGGMDSNICIWEPTGISCKYLTDNTGSISKLLTNETEKVLISGSYDSSVRVFDINSLKCISTLSGVHKNAVTEIEVKNSLCVSGSKDGSLAIWDLNEEKCIKQAKIHGGLIKNIKFLFEEKTHYTNNDNINNNNNKYEESLDYDKDKSDIKDESFDMNYILTAGANDGLLNVIDMRSNSPVFTKQVY